MTLQNYRPLCLESRFLLIYESLLGFDCYSLVVCCLDLILIKRFIPVSLFHQFIDAFNSYPFSVFFFPLVFSNLSLKLIDHLLKLGVIFHLPRRRGDWKDLRRFNVILLVLKFESHGVFLLFFEGFKEVLKWVHVDGLRSFFGWNCRDPFALCVFAFKQIVDENCLFLLNLVELDQLFSCCVDLLFLLDMVLLKLIDELLNLLILLLNFRFMLLNKVAQNLFMFLLLGWK